MKIAAFLAAHRRLLALLGLSLLVHAFAIAWLALAAPDYRAAAPRAALVVRLQPAAPRAHTAAPRPRRAPPGPAALPARMPAPVLAAAPREPVASAGAAPDRAGLAVPAAPRAAAAGASADADAEGAVQMPGRYRVRMPPSALLSYTVVHALRGVPAAPDGAARIAWQTDGDTYTMRSDGITGRLSSQGGSSDAGIAPQAAGEQRADGSVATTRFDAEQQRIVFDASRRSVPINTGSQDRASLLLQLAGIGLAEPDQVKDVIEIFVAGAERGAVARFQVVGQEQLASTLGTLTAWHLMQLVGPGQARLDVWLAPERNWYPVQLRTTAPDGAVSTQVISAIDAGDAGAGAR